MKPLPKFRSRRRETVLGYAHEIFTNEKQAPGSQLVRLDEFDDHHFRAIFRKPYFNLEEGQIEPTKSQWNSLKKKMKRHDEDVFIFKDHGAVECDGQPCYYVDFGFFAQ